jgi:hypothetical protein
VPREVAARVRAMNVAMRRTPPPASARAKLIRALLLIAVGCILNNIALEVIVTCVVASAQLAGGRAPSAHLLLLRLPAPPSHPPTPRCSDKIPWADKKAGALLTFLQYALVAAITSRHAFALAAPKPGGSGGGWLPLVRRLPTTVPLVHYVQMAGLFAVMSLLNNVAFAFNISQPMHMVFRSANLMVTYAFGRAFFGKTCVVGAPRPRGPPPHAHRPTPTAAPTPPRTAPPQPPPPPHPPGSTRGA